MYSWSWFGGHWREPRVTCERDGQRQGVHAHVMSWRWPLDDIGALDKFVFQHKVGGSLAWHEKKTRRSLRCFDFFSLQRPFHREKRLFGVEPLNLIYNSCRARPHWFSCLASWGIFLTKTIGECRGSSAENFRYFTLQDAQLQCVADTLPLDHDDKVRCFGLVRSNVDVRWMILCSNIQHVWVCLMYIDLYRI